MIELVTLYIIVNKQLLITNLFSGYCWGVVRNLFCSISSLEKKNEESNGCCSLNYKTGVQIMAGILTIFSAVFLVLHYVKLDQMIEDKFERMFKQQPTWNLQVNDDNQFHDFSSDLTHLSNDDPVIFFLSCRKIFQKAQD